MDLALTCPTCSWIFATEAEVPVPDHADYLLSRCCAGVGAKAFCVDVQPEWKRALRGVAAAGSGALFPQGSPAGR